jgi:hypothetical protein
LSDPASSTAKNWKVIGNEMSHIKDYDMRLVLVVSTLIGMAGLLASVLWCNEPFDTRTSIGRSLFSCW